MQIIWNENPLKTQVFLDEFEKREMWYKIKIDAYNWVLASVRFALEDKRYSDAEEGLKYEYMLNSKVDEEVDGDLKMYLDALENSIHMGDCTCIACSCIKCHAEEFAGVQTTKGLDKYAGHYISSAFQKHQTIDNALEYLKNYEPRPEPVNQYENYCSPVARWKLESKQAYEWLSKYKEDHFSNNRLFTVE